MVYDYLPFVLAAGVNNVKGSIKMNTSRIIEALLIAGISGGLSMYGTVYALGSKIDALERNQTFMQQEITKMRDDLYTPAGKRDALGWPDSPKVRK